MSNQNTPPTVSPQAPEVQVTSSKTSADRPHLDALSKGFDLAALAGTFIAAIQSQIISTTLGADDQSVAIQATNAFYVGGLILDLMAASLSFLTARWLQRLSETEKEQFELELGLKISKRALGEVEEGRKNPQAPHPLPKRFIHAWLSLSLFMPLPLLVIGVLCMFLGIYTYVWTQQPRAVGIVVSVAGVVALPFVVGVFLIGDKTERREAIISRLVKRQGNW